MPRFLFAIITITGVLCACGDNVGTSANGVGEATVTMVGKIWTVSGTCEKSGQDLGFVKPGDPLLSIGVNTATGEDAIGNFSSVSEGFGVLVGTPRVPKPDVEFSGNSFTVTGTFEVIDGSTVEGTIVVECNF